MSGHTFGGNWTEEKLDCLAKYLAAYRTIFTRNPRARHFRTWYVDAFAGTGTRAEPSQSAEPQDLFDDVYVETSGYRDGSVRKALALANPFDRYLFIEASRHRVGALRDTIKADFAALEPRCELQQGDANNALQQWCGQRNWKRERAVVFLDPTGCRWSGARLKSWRRPRLSISGISSRLASASPAY